MAVRPWGERFVVSRDEAGLEALGQRLGELQVVAVQHNRTLRAFYERLIAAGKEKMIALIAVARKLLTILNAILRDGGPWTERKALS